MRVRLGFASASRCALLLVVASCTDGASASLGTDLPLQLTVAGQFRPGPFPLDQGGPAALDLQAAHENVAIGQLTERLGGHLASGARSAILGIGLDPTGCSATSEAVAGAWIIPAGPIDVTSSGEALTVSVKFGLTPDVSPGPVQIWLAAGDAQGRVGARTCTDLTAVPATTDMGMIPELTISLAWPGAADLDLHVIDPQGHEAFAGAPNTYQPTPGTVDPPFAYLAGGILDHDSNASCERERFPHEDIVWHAGHLPPSGTYIVRVEARTLCGDPNAAWHASAYRQRALLGAARGIATDEDVAYASHGRGAGVTALTFTIP